VSPSACGQCRERTDLSGRREIGIALACLQGGYTQTAIAAAAPLSVSRISRQDRRFEVRGAIGDGRLIEHHDIGKEAFAYLAAVSQSERLCCQSAACADRGRQGQYLPVEDVLPDLARKRPVIYVSASLLALTLFLAVLGRATPGSQRPAVTLGNVLGGLTMLGLFWWLQLETSAPRHTGAPGLLPAGVLGMMLLAMQFSLGTLVSANHASVACTSFPGCNAVAATAGWEFAALDPS